MTKIVNGSIVAKTTTKNGNTLIAVWDFDSSHLPEKGLFKPLTPTDLPELEKCGRFLVDIGANGFVVITPLD